MKMTTFPLTPSITEVTAALHAEVEERGASTRYKPRQRINADGTSSSVCLYVHGLNSLTPSKGCLVGGLLIRLGVPFEAFSGANEDERLVHNQGVCNNEHWIDHISQWITLPRSVWAALRCAQVQQDECNPYEVAAAAYDRVIAEALVSA